MAGGRLGAFTWRCSPGWTMAFPVVQWTGNRGEGIICAGSGKPWERFGSTVVKCSCPHPPWHSAQLGPGPLGLKWEFVQSPRGSLKLISPREFFALTPRSDRVLENSSFFHSQVVFINVHLYLNGQGTSKMSTCLT